MSIKDRTVLKELFENGDIPDENAYADMIDSAANLSGNNTSVGDWSIIGNVTINGTISATIISATRIDIKTYEVSGFEIQGGDLTVDGGDVVITSIGSLVSGIPYWDVAAEQTSISTTDIATVSSDVITNTTDIATVSSDVITNSATYANIKRNNVIIPIGTNSYQLALNQSSTTFVISAVDDGNVQFDLPTAGASDLGTWYSFVKFATGTSISVSAINANIDDSGLNATIYSGSSAFGLSAGEQNFASVEIELVLPTQWHVKTGRKIWTTTEFV